MLKDQKMCQCGCGELSGFYSRTCSKKGAVAGAPRMFKIGHKGTRLNRRKMHGYSIIRSQSQRASRGYVFEHIDVAESVMGKPLKYGAVVHHINGNKTDNRKENLVICENAAYHRILHAREKALRACGHADWKQCTHCHKWEPENKLIKAMANGKVRTHYHQECRREINAVYERKYREKKKSRASMEQ